MNPIDDDTMAALDRLLTREDLPDDGVSRRLLERYVSGDLSREEFRALKEKIESHPEAAAALAALEADDRQFGRDYPWDGVRDSIYARSSALDERVADEVAVAQAGGRRYGRAMLAGAFGGLFALVLAFAIDPAGEPHMFDRTTDDRAGVGAQPSAGDGTSVPGSGPNRVKSVGSDSLVALQKRGGVERPIEAGTTLAEGDRFQFRIATQRSYLILLGVDGTGAVSRLRPVGGDRSEPWTPGPPQPLADAFVLDGSPGPEVFIAFLSDSPLVVEDVEQAVHDVVAESEAGARAALGVDWEGRGVAPEVSVFYVEKE